MSGSSSFKYKIEWKNQNPELHHKNYEEKIEEKIGINLITFSQPFAFSVFRISLFAFWFPLHFGMIVGNEELQDIVYNEDAEQSYA